MHKEKLSIRIIVISCLIFAWSCFCDEAKQRATARHVVLISIDGLLPEFYLPGPRAESCPTLRQLREEGGVARIVTPVYPSLTYPGHATLVTGVTPSRHGIIANTLFTPPNRNQRGAWFAEDLQSPTLWEALHAQGLTAAAVLWPVSAGAEGLTWNLPQFWSSSHGCEVIWMHRYSSPGIMDRLEEITGSPVSEQLRPPERRDKLAAIAAADLLRSHRPNLLLVHFVESDKVQHRYGRGAAQLGPVMKNIDQHVAFLRQTIDDIGIADDTVMIIVGDHGFRDVDRMIGINALFVREGIITLDGEGEIDDWIAMVHGTGNSAGVYFNDTATDDDRERVHALLTAFSIDQHDATRFTLIPAEILESLGGPPQAAFYLEGGPGVMMSSSLHPHFLERRSSMRGNHGGLPNHPHMATGLVIAGAGIKAGVLLEEVKLIDIAPTVANILGVDFPYTEGRVLKELLE